MACQPTITGMAAKAASEAGFNTNGSIIYYDSSGNATLDPAEPQNASSYSHETLLAIYDTIIRFDQDGLTSVPWPKKSIAWSGLKRMELRYYTTKRRRKIVGRERDPDGVAAEKPREQGWMTLTLKSDRQRIDIESTLPHFADIAARAAHAAKEAHLELDQVTIENLSAIGVKGEA